MKFSIVINGTRGDVQPMLALSTELIKKGHQILFCGPPENKQLVESYNCTFIPFGPNYKELFKRNTQMKGGATLSPSPKEMKKQTIDQIDLLPDLLKGSDMILGVGFVLGVHTVADILRIPYRFVIFYPVLLGTTRSDSVIYRLLFAFGRKMTNLVMKGIINKKRQKNQLPPILDVWGHWMGDHVIVACDKELNAARKGVDFKFTQTAYMLLPSQNGLPGYVEQFLEKGKAPVYIGFGSNPIADSNKFKSLFKEVSETTGQRLIISKGWADIEGENSENIIYVDEISFEHLFPRLAAIVYHGGTGTLASASRAGIPQAAFPFMADQFENRKQIVKLGLGPKTCDFKKISASAIIVAINACISNQEFKKNANELAQKLKNSNGLPSTVALLERVIPEQEI